MMTCAELEKYLRKVATGKVRTLYEVDEKTLLFVATDRISAYDVIMSNGIPNKGRLLTLLSAHWFTILTSSIPSLKTHFLILTLPPTIPTTLLPTLQNRSMLVRKLRIFPIEAIVRGYITGSAWAEYKKSSSVHGIPMPAGLLESQEFPQGAIYTPSTKAPAGQSDENIHPDKAAEIVGVEYAKRIEELALQLYTTAKAYAWERGLIIADTKFEFGLDEETDQVVLVDEVLTPDSSRFWSRETYGVGRSQDSFDKQFLRDWLVAEGLKGKEGVAMVDDVVRRTGEKYVEAFEKITGRSYKDALAT